MNTEKQVTSARYCIAVASKGDAIMNRQQLPRFMRASEGAETFPIMFWDDNCNKNLKIPEGSKLGDDGCLNLPEFRCCLAVSKA